MMNDLIRGTTFDNVSGYLYNKYVQVSGARKWEPP
jgi:hypothetical protein